MTNQAHRRLTVLEDLNAELARVQSRRTQLYAAIEALTALRSPGGASTPLAAETPDDEALAAAYVFRMACSLDWLGVAAILLNEIEDSMPHRGQAAAALRAAHHERTTP